MFINVAHSLGIDNHLAMLARRDKYFGLFFAQNLVLCFLTILTFKIGREVGPFS